MGFQRLHLPFILVIVQDLCVLHGAVCKVLLLKYFLIEPHFRLDAALVGALPGEVLTHCVSDVAMV